jgi:hypothetical protein
MPIRGVPESVMGVPVLPFPANGKMRQRAQGEERSEGGGNDAAVAAQDEGFHGDVGRY